MGAFPTKGQVERTKSVIMSAIEYAFQILNIPCRIWQNEARNVAAQKYQDQWQVQGRLGLVKSDVQYRPNSTHKRMLDVIHIWLNMDSNL